jgi:cellulose synthase/poly-beta-1,6-N-acetylglucosamine synthase-like glycosyltransferase
LRTYLRQRRRSRVDGSGHRFAARDGAPSLPAEARIVALIPAHNEEEQIAQTLESVRAQTHPVDRVVVIADNCTDRTAEIAAAAGAEVLPTIDNRAKKAGALNQAMRRITTDLESWDYVLQMDADTMLHPEFVASAIAELEADTQLAGVCARFLTKPSRGFLAWLQRMEYQRLDRHTAHRRDKIHCLSGTATLLRRHVLPQRPWDERSLVEDYALTLDLLERGWRVKRADESIAWTETKPTLHEFWRQRLRWAQGTLEELVRRGWSRHTRKNALAHVWAYFVVTLRWLWLSLIVSSAIFTGFAFAWIWLLPLPIILAERVRSVWPLGWKARLLAASWIADETYQLLWEAYMLHALWASWRKRAVAW